jgi:transcriptional regulator with AAA-type ATPase domain/tetratricopeptide (TPR) repeat protein
MPPLDDVLGESPEIQAVREQIKQLLQRQFTGRRLPPILILGETGTGKGLVARAIHRAGPRAAGPFVDVNCAAIPETLVEAELFGFERGAFTDAKQAKAGLFQAAHRGTLFLDEVGLLPAGLQSKLLTAIEEQAVRRLGSTRSAPVDVWILAATSEDLKIAARTRRFREDLYHRLAVLTLWLPPLRERSRDILLLAEHFLVRACADYGLAPKALTPEARAALAAYSWPGNIRELSHVIERVTLLSDQPQVTAEMLGLSPPAQQAVAPAPIGEAVALEEVVDSVAPDRLLEALRQTDWNISRAAALLGVSRNTLRYRMEKHGLSPGVSPPPRRPAERLEIPARPSPALGMPAAPEPAVVRWERRRLAVLRLVLVAPPADLLRDTGRALEGAMEKVQVFGGRVEEVSPTGVVATFGIEPVEDAALRAALAARAILKAAERTRHTDGAPVAGKFGIHMGQFLVGQVGDAAQIDLEGKREAWAILDTLTQHAEPDSILVTAAAAPFLERRFDLVALERQEPAPGRIYRLSGRERAGLGERMARFVGRQHELQALHQALEKSRDGNGQVVALIGEPGVGKSRLFWEFTHSHRTHAWLVLETRSVSYGKATPYLPVINLLKAYFQVEARDDWRTIRERLTGKLLMLDETLRSTLPAFLALLDAPTEDPQWQALDPPQRRQRTLDAIKRLLIKESQVQPLCLVFEDLHWIDSETQGLLDSLIESLPTARLLLLLNYRPEYRHGWGSKTYYTQVRIDPLPPESAEELLEALLGAGTTLQPLRGLLIERTGGNPFFLEESVWTLVETKALVGERGGYRLATALPTIQVPATVQAVLAARIDRLPLQEKTLLQTAAVIGKDVSFALLQAITDLPEEERRRGLTHLQAAEFLYEASLFPELEYTFKHALTHEVAYESLLPDRRRALHACIVEAIERLYPDRLAEHVDRLAHHAFRGEVWEKALTYLRQAGAKATARSAYREAAACLSQGLRALSHLPDSRETTERAIDLRFELRRALTPIGEWQQALNYLREAEQLATKIGDRKRLGRVFSYLTEGLDLIGDRAGAIEVGKQALAISETLGDLAIRAVTTRYLGRVYFSLGDYHEAIRLLRGNVSALRDDLAGAYFGAPVLSSVASGTYLSWCLAEIGEFRDGAWTAEEAVQVAEEVGLPLDLVHAYHGLGVVCLHSGDFSRAVTWLERGLQLVHRYNISGWLPQLRSPLVVAYTLSGRRDEAVRLLERAVEDPSAERSGAYSPHFARLGEGYQLTSRMADALDVARRALDLARQLKERGNEAWVLRLFGEIASHGDPPDVEKAEAHYRQALTVADELGMRPLVAHCHLGLAKLYRGTGKPQEAHEHLAAATTMYRKMDMRFWLEKAEAELEGIDHA